MLSFQVLARKAQPLLLLLACITYFLGAGIAHYLGHPFHAAAFALGLLAVLTIQSAADWLVEYFRLSFTPLPKDETPRQHEALRAGLFHASLALLTVAGALIATLLLARLLSLQAVILLGLTVVVFIAFAVPPLRIADTGYGELVEGVALGTLFPAWSFLLQSGEYHRLLSFATFPLTLLALAYLLAMDFPTFAGDVRNGRNTLLTRLTWQRAIPIHHMLILASFLYLGFTPLLGFPWDLVWPIFLVLPFAAIQIIWFQRIARGGRALWKFIIPFSTAVFGMAAYLLAMSFWLR